MNGDTGDHRTDDHADNAKKADKGCEIHVVYMTARTDVARFVYQNAGQDAGQQAEVGLTIRNLLALLIYQNKGVVATR